MDDLKQLTALHVGDVYKLGVVQSCEELAARIGTSLQSGLSSDQVGGSTGEQACAACVLPQATNASTPKNRNACYVQLALLHPHRVPPCGMLVQAILDAQRERYGTNRVKVPQDATFLELVWEALQV